MTVILVCGSRNWGDPQPIVDMLDLEMLRSKSLVVTGGQRGADSIAANLARSRGVHAAEVRWLPSTYGRAAGPLRNAAMSLLLPAVDRAYAFPLHDSRGTWDMVRLCREAGTPVTVWRP